MFRHLDSDRYVPYLAAISILCLALCAGCALHVSDGRGPNEVALKPLDGYRPTQEEVSGYVADFSGHYNGSCIQYLGSGRTSRTCGVTLDIHETAGILNLTLSYNSSESYSNPVSSPTYSIRGNSIYNDFGLTKGDIGSRGIDLYDPIFGEITVRSLGSGRISLLVNTLPNQPYLATAVDFQLSASLARSF